MKNDITKSVLCKYIPAVFLCCTLMVLPIAFVHEKGGRELFYISSYLSILGLAIGGVNAYRLLFQYRPALTFMGLSIAFVIWSLYSNTVDNTNEELLYTAGKRCFLTSFIIAYAYHLSVSYGKHLPDLKKLTMASIVVAFCVASLYGFYQSITVYSIDDWRLTMGIDRATMTAYAYTALSIAVIENVLTIKSVKCRNICFFFVAITSFYIIIMTKTRAAMVMQTLFLIYYTIKIPNSANRKKIIGITLLILVALMAASHKTIEKRFSETTYEVSSYIEGNDRTSLGARFTMWLTGANAVLHAPFGQSLGERNTFIKTFLYAKNENNSSALDYINVHLHNEVIEYASTLGVVGVLLLVYFYWVNIVGMMRQENKNRAISLITLSALVYGFTDVLLTSVEYIAILSILMAVLTMGNCTDGKNQVAIAT